MQQIHKRNFKLDFQYVSAYSIKYKYKLPQLLKTVTNVQNNWKITYI